MTADYGDEFTEEVSEPCADGHGVALEDFVAYMPTARLHIQAVPGVLGRIKCQLRVCRAWKCWTQTVSPNWTNSAKVITISASAWLDQQRAGRANDMGPGLADADQRPPRCRRRLDRAAGCHLLQPLPAAALAPGDAAEARPLARPRPRSLIPTTPIISSTGWRIGCSGRQEKINHALVLGGEQGIGKDTLLEPVKHAVGPWNFDEVSPQHHARPVQRLRQVGHPAHQRSARSGRVRPLQLLRSYEGLHRGAARRAARRRKAPARILRLQLSAVSSSPPTTRPTASICRPTTAATTWLGQT